jgi:acyl-CoA synthetase (AMP-forming)/AMP-acid ligase II
MMNQKLKLKKSVERLLSRDDVRLTKEQVNHYLSSGQWIEASFVDYLEHHAKRKPNATAIIDENGKITTYSEFHKQTDRIALALLELGIKPEDRIAIQLPNCSEFIFSLMGAVKASILPVLCHMPYTENDLDYVIGLTEAKAIVIQDRFRNRDYLEMIRKVKERHDCLEHIIVVSDQRYEGTISFYDLLQKEFKSSASQLDELRPVGTDPFVLMFTSGTTGKPKAILHLHTNNLYWINLLNKVLQFSEDGKWLVVPPLAHLTALGLGFMRSLYNGGSIILLSSWDVKKAVDLIESEKPCYFLGAAPMLIDLARFEGIDERDIRSIKGIVYAGSTCPIDILKTLNSQIGCEIYAFYGYSEAGLTHCTRAGDDIQLTSTSFGKVADGLEAKIIDESGNELQAPCEGELLVRGANFIPGYYRQPDNNNMRFDKEGWFHSADIVQMDENGYCKYLARKDDLINRGGYKIDPREIEEVLYTHPMISQVAVVAMPDERLGQRAAAFIIQKDPSKTLTLKDIKDFLMVKGIGKQHWPEAIKIVDSFPMTSTGKIQRFVLREQAKELKPER